MSSSQQPGPDALSEAAGPADHSEREGDVGHDDLQSSTRSRGAVRRLFATVLSVAALAVVFAGVLPRFGDYGEAWNTVSAMSVLQAAVLGLAVLISIVVYVFPLQCALPGLRFWPAFMTRNAAFTLSNAVPGGSAISLGVQYSMLGDSGFRGTPASAAITISGVFNLLVTLVLTLLGILAMFQVGSPTASQVAGAVGGLVAVLALLSPFVLVLWSEIGAARFGAVVDNLTVAVARRLRLRPRATISGLLVTFRRSIVDVLSERWLSVTVSSFAQQITQFTVLVVAVRVTATDASSQVAVLSAFAAFAVARLGTFIPVTPGGLGTVDVGMVGMLVMVGASRSDALTATLLWRAVSWVPQVLIGIAMLILWRIRAARPGRVSDREARIDPSSR